MFLQQTTPYIIWFFKFINDTDTHYCALYIGISSKMSRCDIRQRRKSGICSYPAGRVKYSHRCQASRPVGNLTLLITHDIVQTNTRKFYSRWSHLISISQITKDAFSCSFLPNWIFHQIKPGLMLLKSLHMRKNQRNLKDYLRLLCITDSSGLKLIGIRKLNSLSSCQGNLHGLSCSSSDNFWNEMAREYKLMST